MELHYKPSVVVQSSLWDGTTPVVDGLPILVSLRLQEQCVQYWPGEKGQVDVYGSFQVELCTEDQALYDYTVRKFKISLVDSVSQLTRYLAEFVARFIVH